VSDEFDTGQRPTPGGATRGELLFTFRHPTHLEIACELLGFGRLGWVAQFFYDGKFRYSRRFETRALAVQWAELERQAIEKGGE
jgi:hypothetical protein